MHSTAWGDDELEILRAYYPDHGPSWVGWEEVLPGRTERGIGHKANAIGLRHEPNRARRDEPDPVEAVVAAMMGDGMTPSGIDRHMHWHRGTARGIVVGMWRRDKEGT